MLLSIIKNITDLHHNFTATAITIKPISSLCIFAGKDKPQLKW
jgi:hypothetical protein